MTVELSGVAKVREKHPEWFKHMDKAVPLANKGHIDANVNALAACKSAQEQKDMLLAMLGDLSGLTPLGNRIMTATYVASEVSKGGIIMTDKRKNAARFEGKVGLVIAIGPTAFRYDGQWPWEGPKPAVGDWVWFRATDGAERWLRNVSVRTVEDQCVEGITADPEAIY